MRSRVSNGIRNAMLAYLSFTLAAAAVMVMVACIVLAIQSAPSVGNSQSFVWGTNKEIRTITMEVLCNFTDSSKNFEVAGNLSVEGTLSALGNLSFADGSVIRPDPSLGCLSISSQSVCFPGDVHNGTVFRDTIFFDVEERDGIGLFGSTSNSITIKSTSLAIAGYVPRISVGGLGGAFITSSSNGDLLLGSENSSAGITFALSNGGRGINGNLAFTNASYFYQIASFYGGALFSPANSSGKLFVGIAGSSHSANGLPSVYLSKWNVSDPIISSVSSPLRIFSTNELTLQSGSGNVTINSTGGNLNLDCKSIHVSPSAYVNNSNLSFRMEPGSPNVQIDFFYGASPGVSGATPAGYVGFDGTCVYVGKTACLGNASVGGTVNMLPGSSFSGDITFAGYVTANNLNVTNVSFAQSSITAKNVYVTQDLTSSIAVITSSLTARTLAVGVGGLTTQSGSQFLSNGNALFEGASTVFAGNVLFAPGANTRVSCSTPFASNSPSTPNSYPCIPECLDFTNCDLVSRTYAASASLYAGTNSTPEGGALVLLGTLIDYLSNNVSSLVNISTNAETQRIRSTFLTEISSSDFVNLHGFNRSSMFSSTPTNVNPPPCISYFMLKDKNTMQNYEIPLLNYATSACITVQEVHALANHTVAKNGIVSSSAASVTRTCTGRNAFCSPFFDIFTPRFPLYETIFSLPGFPNQTYDRGVNYVPTNYQIDLKNYAATFAEAYDGHDPDFFSQAAMLSYDPSVETVDSFEVGSFAASVLDGNAGKVTVTASSGIFFTTANSQGNQKTNARIDSATSNLYLSGELLDAFGAPHICCTGGEKKKKRNYFSHRSEQEREEEGEEWATAMTTTVAEDHSKIQFFEGGSPVFSPHLAVAKTGFQKTAFVVDNFDMRCVRNMENALYRMEVALAFLVPLQHVLERKNLEVSCMFWTKGRYVFARTFDLGKDGDGIREWIWVNGTRYERNLLFFDSQGIRADGSEVVQFRISISRRLDLPAERDLTLYLSKDMTNIQILTLV